jgi:hypothetical protein
MNLSAHLRRSRHVIYYFRAVLPEALAKTVGRREVIRSLGTRCPRQAKRAAYLLWADILRRDGGDGMSTKRGRPKPHRPPRADGSCPVRTWADAFRSPASHPHPA